MSQEAGKVVWYSHLFQNFPQFIVIHTVKDFGIVNKGEIDVFLKLSCFLDDPEDVGNLISGSPAFSKTSLNIVFTFTYYWSLAWRILSITLLAYMYVYMQFYIFLYTQFLFFLYRYIQFLYTIFAQSSVDRHLNCFHILTVIDSAATNIEMHVLFPISVYVSFGYTSRCGIPGSYSKKPSYCFLQWLYQFTFLLTVQEGSLLSTSSLLLGICVLFDSHPNRCAVMVVIFISLMTSNVEQLVICLLAISTSSLKNFHSDLSVFNQVVFLMLTCMSFLCILDINSLLVRWYHLEVFFPV